MWFSLHVSIQPATDTSSSTELVTSHRQPATEPQGLDTQLQAEPFPIAPHFLWHWQASSCVLQSFLQYSIITGSYQLDWRIHSQAPKVDGHEFWMYSIECHICTALNVTFKIEMEDHVRSVFDVMIASVQLRTVIQSNLEVRTKMISEFMTCRMPFSDNNHWNACFWFNVLSECIIAQIHWLN